MQVHVVQWTLTTTAWNSFSDHQLCLEVPTASFQWFEESRARMRIVYRHQATTRFFCCCLFCFLTMKDTDIKKKKFHSSSSQKAPFLLGFDGIWSVVYIPGQPTYIVVVVLNGVLRFLSPPWYSIGTVLENVNDTKNAKKNLLRGSVFLLKWNDRKKQISTNYYVAWLWLKSTVLKMLFLFPGVGSIKTTALGNKASARERFAPE